MLDMSQAGSHEQRAHRVSPFACPAALKCSPHEDSILRQSATAAEVHGGGLVLALHGMHLRSDVLPVAAEHLGAHDGAAVVVEV